MDFNRYDKKKLLLLLVFLLVLIQTVAAQNIADTISNIPALQGLTGAKLEQLYDNFWWIWDLIVYTLILGLALKAGASRLGSGGSKLSTVFAIVLGVAAVIAENRLDFNLKKFGPLALTIALFVLGLYLWRMLKGLNLGKGGRVVFALLFLALYGLSTNLLKGLREQLSYINLIPSILDILAIVFFFLLIIDLVTLIGDLRKGGGGGRGGWFGGGEGGGGLTPLTEPPAVRRAEVDEDRRENVIAQEERRQQAEEAAEAADLGRIRNLDFRRDVGFRGVISALDIIVPILEARRFDDVGRATVVTKLNEITDFNTEINRVQASIIATLGNLHNLEQTETAELERMAENARIAIRDEITKKKSLPSDKEVRALNSLEMGWGLRQKELIEDEKKRSFSIIDKTGNTLTAHEREIEQLEGIYIRTYNNAIAALQSGQTANAAVSLRDARNALARALEIDMYVEKFDVSSITRQIRQNYSQIGVENRLRRAIGVGMKKREAVKHAATKKGQQFIGLIKGNILRR